jgi:uncharacterized protein (DUF2249 family)
MLKIINDHDPKPLHHYFTKNHESEFQWEYEQEGPEALIFPSIEELQEDETRNDISHHMVEPESHHQRKEEALLPVK